jgi:hypothetical protein
VIFFFTIRAMTASAEDTVTMMAQSLFFVHEQAQASPGGVLGAYCGLG